MKVILNLDSSGALTVMPATEEDRQAMFAQVIPAIMLIYAKLPGSEPALPQEAEGKK
jgi:hypothetical protein